MANISTIGRPKIITRTGGLVTPGTLIGPYARQVTAHKLKFWVAFRTSRGTLRRYEVAAGSYQPLKARLRPWDYQPGQTYACNHLRYLLPDDLSPYPTTEATPGSIPEAILELLSDDDKVDVARLKIFGVFPRHP